MERSGMLIDRTRAQVLLVDVQERLEPAIEGREELVRNAGILLRAAVALGVPVHASEQYPKGLGPTIPALAELVAPGNIVAKTAFSCAGDTEIRLRIAGAGREQVIIAGMEAHVCVLQSALDLARLGHAVFVVADAVGSRRRMSLERALDRLAAGGVTIVTTEMVVFEWLGTASDPAFRPLSKLIR